MIVTTAGRTDAEMIEYAMRVAQDLEADFLPRKKQSVKKIHAFKADDCIVVGKERLELYPYGETEPFFFHPNSAMFRIKRLLKGEHDPFLEAAGLINGMSLLDCTLGLASDSITASFAVGKTGTVTGLEGNRYLSYIVRKGLQTWDSGISVMNGSMKRINVVNALAHDYLHTLPDNSFDCIYFDPMFEESILESDGIRALSTFAVYEEPQLQTIGEALRVAKKRVVLKDHFRSPRFNKFGFHVHRRKTAKFHFGVLEKK